MEKIVIYGAGNTGRIAYEYLKNNYEILFFVDRDINKWEQMFCGKKVYGPDKLKNQKNTKLVIASVFYEEILLEIEEYKLENIIVFEIQLNSCLQTNLVKELNTRTIDLGIFLNKKKNMKLKELTFMTGGSGVLDYAFLKQIALIFGCKKYLEIGTYIGESINILSDCCEHLYSITAPIDAEFSMKNWCRGNNMPDFSERLAYSDKIEHFYTDSRKFDFSVLGNQIDLYFIDGDHSYEGVLCDTKNVFDYRRDDSIVVWHDFKRARNRYNVDVVMAVKDVLQEKFRNVYVTNNNICGIYIPPQYVNEFQLREMKYEENAPLFTYDLLIEKCNQR